MSAIRHMDFGRFGQPTRGCQKGLCCNMATRIGAFYSKASGKRRLVPMLVCDDHPVRTLQQISRGELTRARRHNARIAPWHDVYMGKKTEPRGQGGRQ